MPDLVFDCVRVTADEYATGPTLVFRLRVSETTGEPVHAIALRVQLRIEPNRRRYNSDEAHRLDDVFGDPSRWADTMRPMQFAHAAVMVPSFAGSVEVDVPVPCTYDMEIAAARYFHSLDDGDVPVLMLFSGTAFTRGDTGFSVAQVPWHKEATAPLPIAEWRRMMDRFFPDSGWLRLSRPVLDALADYKNRRAFATWEHAIRSLLDEVAVERD
jgi:uncharacterized protein DUF6084